MKKYIEKRPWGLYERFTLNEKTSVKILTVKPKQKFSLQYHKKRKEFWRILDGIGKITIGKKTLKAKPGKEFMIPKKTNHRAEASNKPLHILEIAFGAFDEKDIVRIEDIYGRA